MLTDIDIHYLVGLLSLISHPDKVEVELGSRVLDDATGGTRDVDVTVLMKHNGQTSAFKGLEVKKHSRKLDATHVEQLACKLNDMPKITEKAIVSASGYTRPAINKAKKHGIFLFELCDWDFSTQHFNHFRSTFCPVVQRSLEWATPVNVKLNPTETYTEEIQSFLKSNPNIYFGEGEIKPEASSLMQMLKNLQSKAQQKIFEELKDKPQANDLTKRVQITVEISDCPYVVGPPGKIVLTKALFTGQVIWVGTTKPTYYKILRRIDEQKPYAGCMIAELGDWGLVGLTISNNDRNLRLINVPISDRNKNKIFKQKLR